jgi:hypothetical protein
VAAAVLAVSACSDSTLTPATVQSFAQLNQDMSDAVSAHRVQAAALPDLAACQAADTAYSTRISPMVQSQQQFGGQMDDYMRSMGHSMDADMACGAGELAAELARHQAVACASSIAANQAEAMHHVDAMDELIAHQQVRAGEAGSMMGNPGMMGGGAGTWQCEHEADGGYTHR